MTSLLQILYSRLDLFYSVSEYYKIIKPFPINVGIFTAPVEGVYLVATRISTAKRKGAAIFEINHNNKVIARAETVSLRQGKYNQNMSCEKSTMQNCKRNHLG